MCHQLIVPAQPLHLLVARVCATIYSESDKSPSIVCQTEVITIIATIYSVHSNTFNTIHSYENWNSKYDETCHHISKRMPETRVMLQLIDRFWHTKKVVALSTPGEFGTKTLWAMSILATDAKMTKHLKICVYYVWRVCAVQCPYSATRILGMPYILFV